MSPAVAAAPAPGAVWAWVLALRPRTLTAALVPVAVGSALAAREGRFAPLPALAALAGALLIQIGTNLANDYFDFRRGADTAERVGPVRVTQAGWVAPSRVLAAALGSFAAAAVIGVYVIAVGGWPFALVGALSIASGYLYTGGPYPLGYHGLGDVFVFAFFGVVAVTGTYALQAQHLTALAFLASLPVGALATAILVVNNLRDVETDARAGKRTLAVRLGARAARAQYFALLAVSFAVPLALVGAGLARWPVLLPLLCLPLALPPGAKVRRATGAPLNEALGGTARLQLAYGLLFTLGLWVG